MIIKIGNKYIVVSESGKKLSKPASREKAVKRLREIEYFKHHKKS